MQQKRAVPSKNGIDHYKLAKYPIFGHKISIFEHKIYF